MPLMREVEEDRTLVRLTLHIHSGNAGLSCLNTQGPLGNHEKDFGSHDQVLGDSVKTIKDKVKDESAVVLPCEPRTYLERSRFPFLTMS